MFVVGGSAWAQDPAVQLKFTNNGSTQAYYFIGKQTINEVSLDFNVTDYGQYLELENDDSKYIEITAPAGFLLERVQFTGMCCWYNYTSSDCGLSSNAGPVSASGNFNSAVSSGVMNWEGSVGTVRFTLAGTADVGINGVAVWIKAGGGDDSGNSSPSATFDFSSVAAASSIAWSGGSLGAYTSNFSTNQTLTLNNVVLKVNKAGTNTLRFRGGSDPVRLEVTTDDEISIIAPSGNKLTRVVITTVTNGNQIELTSATAGENFSATSGAPFVYTWEEGSNEISTLAFKGARSSYSGRITSIEVSYDESEGGDQGGGDQGGGDPVTYDYTVTITGAPAGQGGVVVGGETKNADFSSDTELDLDALQAADVDGYTGVVTHVGNAITVTYTQDETPGGGEEGNTVELALTNSSGNVVDNENGITVSYPYDRSSNGAYLNLLTNSLVITSEANIVRVELVGSNFSTLSSTPDGWNGSIWSGNSKTVSFSSSARSFLGEVGATITKVRVTLESVGEQTYNVVFNPDNIGGSITIGGNTFTPANNSVTVGKNLNLGHVTAVVDPDDYYHDDVTFSNNTFYVNYHEYTKYSVVLDEESAYKDADAGVVVSGASYGNGEYGVGDNVIKSKGALTQSNFAAKVVQLYDGTVTLNGNTVTVKYTRKVVDPFNFSRFDPSTGSTSTSISEIKLYPPQNEKFIDENLDKLIDLTFVKEENGETVTRPVKAKFSLVGYEGSFVKLTIQQIIGGSYYDGQFTEAGSWGITIPAGFAYLENGSANNAAQVAYVVASFAQLTEVSPANNSSITNNDLIGGNFVLTFDKNINSVEKYNVSVTFPDTKTIGFYGTVIKTQQEAEYYHKEITPLDEYPFGYNDGRDALRVSNAGNKITFTPTAQFWQYYKNHLTTSGYIKFSIDANGITDENNLQNNALVSATYSYSYEAPESAVESSNPEVGTYSLDDREDGLGNITLTFADNFADNISLQSGDALPGGMTFTLPAGVTRGLIYANSGSNELHIGLSGANVAGDYRIQIPKGAFNFANATFGEGVNAAVDQTWTLTAATTFRVNSDAIATEDVEGNEFTATQHNLKKFQAFAVSAPAEQTFSAVTSPVTVDVTVGDADPIQVAATAALEEEGAKAVFTLPAAYTEEGDVSVSVPASALTLGGLTSKAFEFDVTIQPYDYFNITAEPAPETTYTGDRNTIVITLPEGKTANNVGSTISLNGNSETVTAYAIDGNTVTLTLENGFQYGSNYYSIPADFLTDTNGDKNNYFGSWSVNVVKQMMYASAYVGDQNYTEKTITVEKFSSVRVYFDENMGESYNLNDITGITFTNGTSPVSCGGWANYNDNSFFFTFSEISTPGTYTLHIPADVFTSIDGNKNEEVNLDIVIPTPEYFAAMTVTPATGAEVESLKTFTLTAPEGVTFDKVKGLQNSSRVTFDDNNTYTNSVVWAEDNKSVSFNISEVTTDGEHTLVIPAGFLRSTNGEWSPELTATYTVSYPWFTLYSNQVQPNTGEVDAINGITIAAPAGIEFATPAANVTIVVNGVDTQVGASLNGEGNIVLAYTATAANRYDITIPASTFTSTNGKANKELTGITYTIQPTLAINENARDSEGNYWTSFCLNKDFTLEDGYTPYIVVDNGEGGIELEEVKGTEIADEYNVYFNTADDADEYLATMSNGNVISSVIGGKYEVTYNITNGSTPDVRNGVYVDVWNYNKSITFTVRALSDEYSNFTVETRSYMPEQSTSGGSPIETADGVEITASNTTVGGIRIKCFTGTYNTPIVPANTGILVKGAAKSGIQYTPANGTKADVSGNLLVGCTQTATWNDADNYIYKLAWNLENYNKGIYTDYGFYWGSNDGHSIEAHSGKAYLKLPANPANSNRLLIFGGDETITGIDAVENVEDNAPIFNLQGKRVSRENLTSGVYVQNGKKFIVK